MVQAADRRDDLAVLFQSRERLRKRVIRAGGRHFPGGRVDAVGQVDEHAALRAHRSIGSEQRPHAIEQWQSQRDAETAEDLTAINEPALCAKV